MIFEFRKDEYVAATRHLLADLAQWMRYLFDDDVPTRIFGIDREIFSAQPEAWEQPGSAGQEIEQSTVLRSMRLVLDCLNSNTWNGDADSLRWEVKNLRPLYALITSRPGLQDPEEGYFDLGEAATLYCELVEVISARVYLDMDYYPLNIRELARVAGLAEKTVRMAAVGRDRNPELVTQKVGGKASIEVAEARRWLATKGIEYRPIQYIGKGTLPVARPATSYELASCLSDLRHTRSLSMADLVRELHWSKSQQTAYTALESGNLDTDTNLLSLDEVIALAQALCPDESSELARRIDGIIHPIALRRRLDDHELTDKKSGHDNDD